jgi:hypothetical protein
MYTLFEVLHFTVNTCIKDSELIFVSNCWCRSGHQTLKRTITTVLYAETRTVLDLSAGASPSLCASGRSAPGASTVHAWARTVRDGAEGHLLRSRPRSRVTP